MIKTQYFHPFILSAITAAFVGCGGGGGGKAENSSSASSASSSIASSEWSHLVSINAGSRESDIFETTKVILSDRFFDGGHLFTKTSVVGDSGYTQTFVREGEFSYHIPVSAAQYKITLHFDEPRYERTGERIFSVALEDKSTSVSDLDLIGKGYASKTYSVTLDPTTVNDGFIDLTFTSLVGGALVSRIDIETLSGALKVSPPATQTATEENTGSDCAVTTYPTSTSLNTLPDPFEKIDGTRITQKSQWRCLRQETLRLAEAFVLGEKPSQPEKIEASMNGSILNLVITQGDKSVNFSASVSVPDNADAATPILINLPEWSSRRIPDEILDLGQFIVVTPAISEISLLDTSGDLSGAFYELYGFENNAGHHIARAWGVSRIIDALSALQTEQKFTGNLERIGVFGIGLLANSAFIAGAFDERISLTLALDPSASTISNWRSGINIDARGGLFETGFANYARLTPNSLSVDAYQLVGLIAPRAVAISATYSTNSANKQIHVAAQATQQIFKALDLEESFALDISDNYRAYGQISTTNDVLAAHVKKFLLDETVTTGGVNAKEADQENLSTWRKWSTPTLQ